jgi:hypothetical protein
MSGKLVILALAATLMVAPGCTKKPEPVVEEKAAAEKETVMEQAEQVGDVGDATVTTGLKDSLTGAVQAQQDHDAELDQVKEP